MKKLILTIALALTTLTSAMALTKAHEAMVQHWIEAGASEEEIAKLIEHFEEVEKRPTTTIIVKSLEELSNEEKN